ncbi:MAG: Rid family hydrolase [bacterium]|nr:Rid family hydrolase [bacterium]
MAVEKPNVVEDAHFHVTDWGRAVRVDVNRLGALLPAERSGETWSEETSKALQNAWSEAQNEALCQALEDAAGAQGGDFRSFVEWTVLHNRLYDGTHMRDVRRARFGEKYRASITTLGWAHADAKFSTRIQAVAYVPKPGEKGFEQKVWQPECLYDTEFMALAPTVITRFGGARQIHISGVVAWDDAITPLFVGDPERQIAHVFDVIQRIFEEAGGSLSDVVRLRPFAHNTEVAGLIRQEVARRWAGRPRPVVMMSDSRSFGNPPKLYTEIQVMGVLPDGEAELVQRELDLPAALVDENSAVMRSSRAAEWELVQVGELRAAGPGSPEEEAGAVVAQIDVALRQASLRQDDVCLAFVYASSPQAAAAFETAAAEVLNPACIHVLISPPMPELSGRHIKVELTARHLV